MGVNDRISKGPELGTKHQREGSGNVCRGVGIAPGNLKFYTQISPLWSFFGIICLFLGGRQDTLGPVFFIGAIAPGIDASVCRLL